MSDEYGTTGNDNDSGSSSPSDTGSSGGTDWGGVAWEAAGQFLQNLDNTSRPTTPSSPGSDGGPPLLNPAIQRLFEAAQATPPRDERSVPRQVMEQPRWYVVVDADGRDLVKALPAEQHARQPFTRPPAAPPSTRNGRAGRSGRTSRTGQPQDVTPTGPLRVAQAFAVPPDAARGLLVRDVTSRALARAIPDGADGVLFRLATGAVVGLLRDEWPLLEQLADSFDLETMLVRPGAGQAAALGAARWYLSAAHGLAPQSFGGSQLIYVYTHPDRAEASDGAISEVTGLKLAERLARRDNYDGVRINPGEHVGEGDDRIFAFCLGPDLWPALLQGRDPRPGAAPLPARTLAEVHLWLDLADFPHPVHGRELVPVATPDGLMSPDGLASPEAGQPPTPPGRGRAPLLVQARTDRASDWRIVETGYRQSQRPGPTLGPVFAVSEPDAPPGSLGDGPTQILCAGKLANHLYQGRYVTAPRWFVAKRYRVWAAERGTWAHELRKLLPPGADALPRSSIRTAAGAELVRKTPQMASRAWIEERCAYYDGIVRRGWLGL